MRFAAKNVIITPRSLPYRRAGMPRGKGGFSPGGEKRTRTVIAHSAGSAALQERAL